VPIRTRLAENADPEVAWAHLQTSLERFAAANRDISNAMRRLHAGDMTALTSLGDATRQVMLRSRECSEAFAQWRRDEASNDRSGR
jgi:hypothetical protein